MVRLGMNIICTVVNDLTYDQRMHRICAALAASGHCVTLVGRVLTSSAPLSPRSFYQKRLRCFFNKGKLFYVEYNIRLAWLLIGTRFDVVNSVDLDTLSAGWLVATLKRKRVVYDAHEYFTEVPELITRPLTKKIWELAASFLIPRVHLAYTVGEALAKVLEERYEIPFGVVRNVPLTLPSQPSKENQAVVLAKYGIVADNRPVLFYQGALNEGRGIPQLFAALPLLPNVVLWLAGEGDLSASLRQMAEVQGIAHQVVFLGYVLPADLKMLTPLATIGLNLLENKGLNYYYSLANKCFDYIHAGIPCLHPDFPEYRSIQQVGEIGILLPDLQPNTIANGVKKLLENPTLYANIQQSCSIAAQLYHWEQEATRLIAMYEAMSIREYQEVR